MFLNYFEQLCLTPMCIITYIVCQVFFSQILPLTSLFHSHCHFLISDPHLSCCSSVLTGSLFLILPSYSSEVGREQSHAERGHIKDMQGKKSEQTGRKVTLIEVRGKLRKLYHRVNKKRFRKVVVNNDKCQREK